MIRLAHLATLIALVVASLFAGTVLAKGKPSMQHILLYQNIQQPVEQQTLGGCLQPDESLWVVNPTECPWDADDQVHYYIHGRLWPGKSYGITSCVIADWHTHLVSVNASWRGKTTLRFTVRVGDQVYARTSDTGAVSLCAQSPEYDHGSPLLPPVEGSNGGVGIMLPVTWTVENIGSRSARDVVVFPRITSPALGDMYCTDGYGNGQF